MVDIFLSGGIIMYYYYDGSYFIYMIVSLLIAGFAQFKVKSAFNKYSKIKCNKNITGEVSAKTVLEHNNVFDVSIGTVRGFFTDFFDSRNKSISLSDEVYSKATIASVSVAAHEAGHAVQNDQGYLALKIRQKLAPITQLCSNLAMPLIFIGFSSLPLHSNFIIKLGIAMFTVAVLFQVVTLPVEFNASKRALKSIKETQMLTEDEISGAKEVLTAAAFTYVASTVTSIMSLIRLLFLADRRRR